MGVSSTGIGVGVVLEEGVVAEGVVAEGVVLEEGVVEEGAVVELRGAVVVIIFVFNIGEVVEILIFPGLVVII